MRAFDQFVRCSQRVKALRQRSWGPLPTSLLVGVAERKISKGVKAKLTRDHAGEHGVVRYDTYCTRGRAEAVTCAVNGNRENERTIAMARKQKNCCARPVFHVLWVLAGIKTVNLSRATCFVIVLVPAIVERHVLIPTSGAKSSDW